MLHSWKFDIFLLIIFFFASVLLVKINNTIGAVILAFLPSICDVIYKNSEGLQLLISKFWYRNKNVALKLNVQKRFDINKDFQLYENNENILNQKIKQQLKNKGISVGEENKKLRIERQTIEYNGNKIDVKMPFLLEIQIDDYENEIILFIKNYVNPMKYIDITKWLNEAKYLWGFIEEELMNLTKSKRKSSAYECEITLDKNIFMRIYLANFVKESEIKELYLNRLGYQVLLKEQILKIISTSEKAFIEAIEKYAKFSVEFFDK